MSDFDPQARISVSLPSADGMGSVHGVAFLDDAGEVAMTRVFFEIDGASMPPGIFPEAATEPLRHIVHALRQMAELVPDPGEYRRDRCCPQCHGPLLPGDGLGGGACYECEHHRRTRSQNTGDLL